MRAAAEVCARSKGDSAFVGLLLAQAETTLRFDCKPCEMHVVGKMKRAVINQHAKEMQEFPMQFYRTRPVPSASA